MQLGDIGRLKRMRWLRTRFKPFCKSFDSGVDIDFRVVAEFLARFGHIGVGDFHVARLHGLGAAGGAGKDKIPWMQRHVTADVADAVVDGKDQVFRAR